MYTHIHTVKTFICIVIAMVQLNAMFVYTIEQYMYAVFHKYVYCHRPSSFRYCSHLSNLHKLNFTYKYRLFIQTAKIKLIVPT